MVEGFEKQFELCLHNRPFREEFILSDYYDEMNFTLYGHGNKSTSAALDDFDILYSTGYIQGEEFSAADGIIMDGLFYGNIFVNNDIFFIDPAYPGNQTMHKFNDILETYKTMKKFQKMEVEDNAVVKLGLENDFNRKSRYIVFLFYNILCHNHYINIYNRGFNVIFKFV